MPEAAAHPALAPVELAGLRLRNRIIKTATYEGMTPKGQVTQALIDHHAQLARRGVGLTTVAYGAVARDGRTFPEQLLVDEDARAGLRELACAVHEAGGAVSLQLAHCGGFSKLRGPDGAAPRGPSPGFNAYGLAAGVPRIRAMRARDIEAAIDDFARAAQLATEAGVDALELHCGHGYLLSQFLSPLTNRRRDAWGGELTARLRLPLAVVRAVRAAVGEATPLLAKLNLRDGVPGGLELAEAVQVAAALERAGVDALVPSGGMVQKSAFFLLRGAVPVARMAAAQRSRLQGLAMRALMPMIVKAWPYRPAFFREDAEAVLDAVSIPVALLGGVDSSAVIRGALARGFSLVAMGRALLADPDFIERLARGEEPVSRCTHCNECVAEMDRGGVRCVL